MPNQGGERGRLSKQETAARGANGCMWFRVDRAIMDAGYRRGWSSVSNSR